MTTARNSASGVCFLCHGAHLTSHALPNILKSFFLRSVLQLSYKTMANFLEKVELILLCGECKGLVSQAFDLEEDIHQLQVQQSKLLDQLKFRMNVKGLQAVGLQTVSLTRGDEWDEQNERLPYNSETSNEIDIEDHVKVEICEDSELDSNNVLEQDKSSSPNIVSQILTNHPSTFPSGTKPQTNSISATALLNDSKDKNSIGHYCKYKDCKLFLLTELQLKTHYQTQHGERFVDQTENMRRNKCNYKGCGKGFRLKTKLQEHKKIYHGKPHICEYRGCRKRFQSSQLRDHIYSSHKNRMRHKYKCVIPGCNKVYRYEKEFIMHQTRCEFQYNCSIEIDNMMTCS